MAVASAIDPLVTAVIGRLNSAVTMVGGRVFTGQVPQNAQAPYLVLYGYSERPAGHYGHGGSDTGINIRGVVHVPPPSTGDKLSRSLYAQVYAALHEYLLPVEGHQEVYGSILFVTGPYLDPDDPALLHFVARYEALTAVAS